MVPTSLCFPDCPKIVLKNVDNPAREFFAIVKQQKLDFNQNQIKTVISLTIHIWPITANANDAISQSELEAKARKRYHGKKTCN